MAEATTQRSLDAIRQEARQLWSREAAAATGGSSYRSHYGAATHRPEAEPPRPPISPTRRNKPHPSQLFMTCRLHYVADYNGGPTSKAVQTESRAAREIDSCCDSRAEPSTAAAAGRYGSTSKNIGSASQNLPLQRHQRQAFKSDAHPDGLVFQPTRVRGDFLIHPDWPPTLSHHRVP